ncbi:hypothetical protein Micbo1qcDRAFT_219124 [Microdochium bolleyi]|uniref:NmrA-like domain-containing protein n=1 Tax=Microdochium bolleyi TaxID=196109 RepID=A0A136INV3_9PEZI|nr:hypothetical protein Micbo1qcDRAFT_219124 [Microdochium bolleyi]
MATTTITNKPQQARSIALVGATGHIGKPILSALLAPALHKITVLTRADSPGVFPASSPSLTVHRVPSYDDQSTLTPLLASIDVLIVAVSFTAYAVQTPLFRAAAAAGVKYILPCEFGGDPHARGFRAHLDVFTEKEPYRALIEELGVSSWIGVCTGPWFDFTMGIGGFGIDVKGKTALMLGSSGGEGAEGPGGFGMQKASVTTYKRVGEMVAQLLSLPEDKLAEHRNQWVYLTSWAVSQRELLESAMRVAGADREAWSVTEITVEQLLATAREKMSRQETFMEGRLSLLLLVFGEGLGGDFGGKVLDAKDFGLDEEDLDEVMREVIG